LKYHNKKVEIDGIKFDSKKEANRYCELKLMQYAMSISHLELQKEFVLIPAQYVNGKCVERACKYKADFYYYDELTNKWCCEDTKGFRTKEYIIKRKLMLYVHGIQIIEI
jgi:hypothetical protein